MTSRLTDNKNNIIQEFKAVSHLNLFADSSFILKLNTQIGSFDCQGKWFYIDKKTIRLESLENKNNVEYDPYSISVETPCTRSRNIKILSDGRLKVPGKLTEEDKSFLIFKITSP